MPDLNLIHAPHARYRLCPHTELSPRHTCFGNIRSCHIFQWFVQFISALFTVSDRVYTVPAAVTHDAVSALEFSAGRKPSEAGLSGKDFADSLCAVIDCDMSEAFPQTAAMALASLPRGSLEMRMEALRSRYRNEGLRSRATDMMMAE